MVIRHCQIGRADWDGLSPAQKEASVQQLGLSGYRSEHLDLLAKVIRETEDAGLREQAVTAKTAVFNRYIDIFED